MCRTQLLAVRDAHQVTDDAPTEAEPVDDALERLHQALPGWDELSLQTPEVGREVGEQRADRGLHLVGAYLIEAW